ncbi:hypothetical protein H9Q70_005858 [Fusarium xylarioides]|nr:hypothetical protein H9Q70_005858 [Fusarium xylarioides]KAG5821297.1 hypothetical protein H9Q74_008388 [Fusarium xylarioides]
MRYLHRTLMAAFIVPQSQLSGASVIQNFQNTFYAIVGITGRQSLLVSGIYGVMGVIGTIIYLGIVVDRVSIAFIFIYSATFAIFSNAMIWAVPSGLFPTFLRSRAMAFAVSSKSVVAIVLSQITHLALAEVS